MYKFEDLRRLEIEPTNTCQARCPQCLRTPADGSVNRTLKDELSLDLIKQQIPVEFWNRLTSINFQGSTGDALAYPNLVELIEYMKLHLISLEQDSKVIAKELEDVDETYDSADYERLEVEDISTNGQIIATRHLLSVANDIMGKTKGNI